MRLAGQNHYCRCSGVRVRSVLQRRMTSRLPLVNLLARLGQLLRLHQWSRLASAHNPCQQRSSAPYVLRAQLPGDLARGVDPYAVQSRSVEPQTVALLSVAQNDRVRRCRASPYAGQSHEAPAASHTRVPNLALVLENCGDSAPHSVASLPA